MGEVLRPREFGGLLSQTLSVALRSLPRLLAIQGLFWLMVSPLFVGFLFIVASFARRLGGGPMRADDATLVLNALQGSAGALLFALYYIMQHVPQAASTLVVADHFTGGRTTLREAFAIAWRRLGGLIGVAMVYGLLLFVWYIPGAMMVGFGVAARLPGVTLLGGVLFIAGMIVSLVVSPTFLLSSTALLLERASVADSLGRSRHLTKGFRGRTLGLSIFAGALAWFVGLVASAPLELWRDAVEDDNPVMALGLWAVAHLVSGSLAGIVPGVLAVVIYFDLRVRKEAFDIERLAELVDVIRERREGPRQRREEGLAGPRPGGEVGGAVADQTRALPPNGSPAAL